MTNETHSNGIYKDVNDIKRDVQWLRDDLAPAIRQLTDSVNKLVSTVDSLSTKFEAWVGVAATLIPVQFVARIFGWLFAIIMGIFFGVEAVRWLFNSYLPAIN